MFAWLYIPIHVGVVYSYRLVATEQENSCMHQLKIIAGSASFNSEVYIGMQCMTARHYARIATSTT